MSGILRSGWTEGDITALPAGEHDYFERKSGRLFENTDALLGALAKTLSALANSGGGHVLLGVADDGALDGVPPFQGRTSTRDWLEQKLPGLLDYALSDFRVHRVTADPSGSTIPAGRDVIAIDVGDSPLAPHQCAHDGDSARKGVYYHRRGGRSEPAPHFYLELLRQRLVSPRLEVTGVTLTPVWAARQVDQIFVAFRLRFVVRNSGRVAAYKWAIHLAGVYGYPEDRDADYVFNQSDFPVRRAFESGIRLDDTLLPGSVLDQGNDLGIYLRVSPSSLVGLEQELHRMVTSLTVRYRVATETSLGDEETRRIDHLSVDELASAIRGYLDAFGG